MTGLSTNFAPMAKTCVWVRVDAKNILPVGTLFFCSLLFHTRVLVCDGCVARRLFYYQMNKHARRPNKVGANKKAVWKFIAARARRQECTCGGDESKTNRH
jgi:hypothetical protein